MSAFGLPRELPRVAIDARMVTRIPHGFARYVSRLATGLRGIEAKTYEPVFLVHRDTDRSQFYGYALQEVSAPFLHPSEQWAIPRALKEAGASLYHSPTFSSLAYCPCPWLSTVHDLNHLHYGGFKERLYYRFLLRPFARKARKLLTVSEFSRREIASWIGISESAIGVVHNALDPALATAPAAGEMDRVLGQYGLVRERYFLALSNMKPHKNLELLVDAFVRFQTLQKSGRKPGDPEWQLVLSVKDFAEVPGVRALGGVDEETGRCLLHGAAAVAFPSLYEGFGLPPVEAATAGIRVIASSIEPHHEGLGLLPPDEVLWADPRQETEWAEAMKTVAEGRLKRPSTESRRRLLDRFSPAALVWAMDGVYREILDTL